MTTRQKSRQTFAAVKDPSVILFIIDPQVDFHEGGSLAISGATADSERITKMIRSNIRLIDEIYVTMDSHHINHIAHQSFWEWGNVKGKDPEDPIYECDMELFHKEIERTESNKDDEYQRPRDDKIRPKHYTTISSDDVAAGIWLPVDRSLRDYCVSYAAQLEQKGKFKLTIWPNHCLIGTEGHSIVDNINQALQQWTRERMKIVNFVKKGMNCLTEMYSAIEAEVPVISDHTTTRNNDLLKKLRFPKRLVVCGQALSHCVRWSVTDILNDWKAAKCDFSSMTMLKDGSTAVALGDCPQQAQQFLLDIQSEGVRVVTCAEGFEGLKK